MMMRRLYRARAHVHGCIVFRSSLERASSISCIVRFDFDIITRTGTTFLVLDSCHRNFYFFFFILKKFLLFRAVVLYVYATVV